MPFSLHQGVLEPEQLDLLTRVLVRIVNASPTPLDEPDKRGVARRLLAGFSSGRREEEELFQFGNSGGPTWVLAPLPGKEAMEHPGFDDQDGLVWTRPHQEPGNLQD